MTTSGSGAWRLRAIGAVTLLLTPALMLAVLIFLPGQVRKCLALYACASLPPPEPVLPIIGTNEGIAATLVLLGSAWLVVAAVVIRYLWSIDRRRLRRVILLAATIAIVTALAVGGSGLLEGQRLRAVAENAGMGASGALLVTLPLLLAWAVLTVRPSPTGTA